MAPRPELPAPSAPARLMAPATGAESIGAPSPVEAGGLAALPGVPSAEQQARLEAQQQRQFTVDDLRARLGAPTPTYDDGPQTWRPAVVRSERNTDIPLPDLTNVEVLPPDVMGVEELLYRNREAIDVCMRWSAPRKLYKEDRAILDVTIAPEETGKAVIAELGVRGDAEGRYTAFLECMDAALAGATFSAPHHGGEEVVSWALLR